MSRIIPNNTVIVDPITGVQAEVESNRGLAVNVNDQTTRAFDAQFIQATNQTTLTVAAVAGDTSITVADATGFVDGKRVGITTPTGDFFFGEQVGAAVGLVINLDRQVDTTYPIGSNVLASIQNMNVNGSIGSPEIFQIGPVGVATGISVDIVRFIGYLQDGTDMDDGKFGGLTALTYGVVLRKNFVAGDYLNYWNAKTNGKLAALCYDFTYSEKAPAGSYGARFRNSYGGQEKHGVVIRLSPGDTLEMVIQDDLTGLENFVIIAQGHFVSNGIPA